MRPDIDDLIVAFAERKNALAILLLNVGDLLLRVLDFLALFLRNDHVIDSDGNTGASRFLEAEFLEAVQRLNGLVVTAMLVAVPDQVTDVRFADDFVRETKFCRPDFTEDHTADRGLDDFTFRITENGLLAEVRIREFHA